MFGKVLLETPDRTIKTKTGSVLAINVIVPVNGTGLRIKSAVWGKLMEQKENGIDQVELQASFPSGPRSTITGTKEFRDAFVAHVEDAISEWPGLDSTITDASNALLNRVPVTVAGKAPRKALTFRVAALAGMDSNAGGTLKTPAVDAATATAIVNAGKGGAQTSQRRSA